MTNSPLTSTKKCPHCQQWSTWKHDPNDRCEHCGELLDPQRHRTAAKRAKQEQKPGVFDIDPEDSAVVRFFKRIGRGGQIAFAAIMAFFVWMVTVLLG